MYVKVKHEIIAGHVSANIFKQAEDLYLYYLLHELSPDSARKHVEKALDTVVDLDLEPFFDHLEAKYVEYVEEAPRMCVIKEDQE